MADKQTSLAIVLKAVDQQSAVIRRADRAIDKLTQPRKIKIEDPFQGIHDRLDGIATSTGLSALLGVGRAIKGLFMGAAEAMGFVVTGALLLVKHFDDMGDRAEKLDVTVDFLAAMGYAAERSGSSVETFDQGIGALAENMGQLRAGTGRMLKFLGAVSPALVTQLKATKGNEAAFRLLADAMSKITDPQKRLALALKTVGNSDLAVMLAKGSAGLLELQGQYIGLAGSQEEAAEAGGKVDDALRDLKASGNGLQAALMRGLAPALLKIIPMTTEWLSGHREQITAWLVDFGERLPGAVDAVVEAIKGAIDWVNAIVRDLGGWEAIGNAVKDLLKGGLVTAMILVKATADQLSVAVKAMMIAWDVSPIKAIIDWFGKLADFLDSIGVKTQHLVNLLLKLTNILPGVQLGDAPDVRKMGFDEVHTRLPGEQPGRLPDVAQGPHPLEMLPRPTRDISQPPVKVKRSERFGPSFGRCGRSSSRLRPFHWSP